VNKSKNTSQTTSAIAKKDRASAGAVDSRVSNDR